MDKLNEEFIYQKKDFVKLGVKEGSFYKMIKDLEIDTPEYCNTKILKNGIQAKCFNQKAFDIISKYINEKGEEKFECVIVGEAKSESSKSTIPCVPLPGTYQYCRPVTVVNKEDFE